MKAFVASDGAANEVGEFLTLEKIVLKRLMHKSKFPKLLVVGDDWQSIYKFAGGEVDVLMNFKKYYGKYSIWGRFKGWDR